MSYVVLGKNSNSDFFILDTDDLVTDVFSKSEFKNLKQKGIDFTNTLNIGLTAKNNIYQLFISGYNRILYRGEFPLRSKRNNLFDFNIKLSGFNIVDNKLVIAVIANCWCKYDIEVPMVLCHVLFAPILNIGNLQYACKTQEPVYFSTESILNKQYKFCMGDFPNRSLSPSNCNITVTHSSLKVFGVDYGSKVPVNDILDEKLKYNIINEV